MSVINDRGCSLAGWYEISSYFGVLTMVLAGTTRIARPQLLLQARRALPAVFRYCSTGTVGGGLQFPWQHTNLVALGDAGIQQVVALRNRANLPMSSNPNLPECVAKPNEQVPPVLIPTFGRTSDGDVPIEALGYDATRGIPLATFPHCCAKEKTLSL